MRSQRSFPTRQPNARADHPAVVLWLLMWPLAAYMGARHLRHVSDRVPATSLPLAETSPRPSTWRRWLYLVRIQADFFVLAWIDRLSTRRWQARFKAEGLTELLQTLGTRPLVIVSIYTTSLVVLAGWVSSLGIPTGSDAGRSDLVQQPGPAAKG